jgi:tetratricopeptide (TPR) repeat protein
VPFQFDDAPNIWGNPIVKDLGYFAHPDRAAGFTRYEALRMRYVGYLTFALNYRLHGLDVAGYHVVNTAIHLVNVLLLYALVMLSFRTPLLRGSPLAERAHGVALLAAALFAVHPVNTQAVTYIVQRFASLAALCYLGSMVCYIEARLSRRKLAGIAYYLACLALAVAAMKTKENAFTLPLAVALYEVSFFPGEGLRRRALLLPLLLTMLIIPLTLANADRPMSQILANVTEQATAPHFSRGAYLLTEARAVPTYLRLLVLPVNQTLVYDYPRYSSLAQAPVLLSLVFVAAIFWLVLHLYRRGGPAGRLAAFGIVFFFLSLSVESTLVPLAPLYEHRLYLPMTGLAVATSVGAAWVYGTLRTGRGRRLIVAVCATIVVLLAIMAGVRNRVWATPVSLWQDVVRKAPGDVRGLNNLAALYMAKGRLDEARGLLDTALKVDPDFAETYSSLGLLEQKQGHYEEAIARYLKALRLKPIFPEALDAIGVCYDRMGRYQEAQTYYHLAIQLKPEYDEAYTNLGASLGLQGRYPEAERALEKAMALNPDSPDAINNLANIRYVRGELDAARRLYLRSLALAPRAVSPRVNLIKIYIKLSEFGRARRELETLKSVSPDDARALESLIP